MIGIFDSGFGGLTIFKDIERALPNYDYIYLGDNARAPYGDCSQSVVCEYTKQAVDYLFKQGADLIILACNTASAEALRKIQQEYLPVRYPDKRVLGVIRPLAEEASQKTKHKKIAVLGTNSTIESKAYIRELQNQDPDIQVFQQACPLLVNLVEKGREQEKQTKKIIIDYIKPLKKQKPDTVILGCTHYGYLQDKIQEIFGLDVLVLDSGQIIAKKLQEYLQRYHDLVQIKKSPTSIFLTTGDTNKFDVAAQKFLGRTIKSQKINL